MPAHLRHGESLEDEAKRSSSKLRFSWDSGSLIAGQACAMVLETAGIGIVPRGLPPALVGQQVLTICAAMHVGQFLHLGLPHAVLCAVGGSDGQAQRLVRPILLYVTGSAVLATVCAFAVLPLAQAHGVPWECLVWAGPLLGAQMLSGFVQAMAVALEAYRAAAVSVVVSRAVYVGSLVGLSAAGGLTLGAALWTCCAAVALRCILVMGLTGLRPWARGGRMVDLLSLRHVAVKAQAVDLGWLGIRHGNLYLLALLRGDVAAAFYSRALWFFDLPVFCVRTVGMVLWQRVSASPTPPRLLTRWVLRCSVVASVAAVLLGLALGRQALTLVNGPGYAASSPALYALALGLPGAAAWRIATSYYAGQGYNWPMVRLVGACFVGYCLLSWPAVVHFGAVGAAGALAASVSVMGVGMYGLFRNEARLGSAAGGAAADGGDGSCHGDAGGA